MAGGGQLRCVALLCAVPAVAILIAFAVFEDSPSLSVARGFELRTLNKDILRLPACASQRAPPKREGGGSNIVRKAPRTAGDGDAAVPKKLPAAWWPTGRWIQLSSENASLSSVANYDFTPELSARFLLQPYRSEYRTSFTPFSWVGTDLLGDQGANRPFVVPGPEAIRSLLANRNIVVIGDSLARQQYLTLGSLAELASDADCRMPCRYNYINDQIWEEGTFNPSLGTFIATKWAIFSMADNRVGPPSEEGYYYEFFRMDEEDGNILERPRHSSKSAFMAYVDLDHLEIAGEALIAHLAFEEVGTIIVINFGNWLRQIRSNIILTQGGVRITTWSGMRNAIRILSEFTARYFSERLKEGNIVVWQGLSPRKGDTPNCAGGPDPKFRAIYDGIRPFLDGRRQFYIDAACPLESFPDGHDEWGLHWKLPGPLDLQSLYVLRLLEILDPPRRERPFDLGRLRECQP